MTQTVFDTCLLTAVLTLTPLSFTHWCDSLKRCPHDCQLSENVRILLQMTKWGEVFADYYTVLGIDDNATDDDVRAAFAREVLINHPDKASPMASDAERAAKTVRTRMILDAKNVLLDPIKRDEYDAALKLADGGQPQFSAAGANASMADVWEVWIKVVLDGFVQQYRIGTTGERAMQVLGTLLPPALSSALSGSHGLKVGMAFVMLINQRGVAQVLQDLSGEEQRMFMAATEILYKNMM